MMKQMINKGGFFLLLFSLTLIFLFSSCGDNTSKTKENSEKSPPPNRTALAEIKKIPDWYEAIGTIRPRTETNIEATVTAQVLDIKVQSGSQVMKGDLLISLDARQLKSRMGQAKQVLKSAIAQKEQARQSLSAARAAFKQAEADFTRIKKYFESQAATQQDKERAESAYLQAKAAVKRAHEGLSAADAGIEQAEEVIKESKIAVSYTRIVAPEDGVVLKRFVDPGDLALPGKPLISLRTKGALRLEAYVREGLISKIRLKETFPVTIDTLSLELQGTVEEIVPYADPSSRTFLVKTALPQVNALYPGMFGKLLVQVDLEEVVLIPSRSIRQVGQLELIRVQKEEHWQNRFIRTGRTIGDQVEVLSGLSGNETIGWKE